MFTCSLETGTIPDNWRTAVVTPVNEITKPSTLSEYISVIPVLCRIAEIIIAVSNWHRPNMPL